MNNYTISFDSPVLCNKFPINIWLAFEFAQRLKTYCFKDLLEFLMCGIAFYPTVFKGCAGIVFIYSISGFVGGQWKEIFVWAESQES